MHQHGLRFWDRVFGWRRRAEARATLRHAQQFLTPGSTALDIGCGIGYALDVLEDEFACVTYGCDVVTPPIEIARFARFDGRALPYHDKSFDVTFLIFVLHHADDPGVLLREAARVTKRALIVVEDTPQHPAEHRWGSMHVQSFKTRHSIPWHGRVRDDREWRQIFQFMGMSVLHAERLGRFERLPPVSRTCFVLSPEQAAAGAAGRVARTATS